MCHNTKVNTSLCHLGKAVALTDGGTAFSPEPKPPSLLPPCSDINTPKIIFCTLWHHHTCCRMATLNPSPLGFVSRFSFFTVNSFVTREVSRYKLNATHSKYSHMSLTENFTDAHRCPTAGRARRKVKGSAQIRGFILRGSWVFAINVQTSR